MIHVDKYTVPIDPMGLCIVHVSESRTSETTSQKYIEIEATLLDLGGMWAVFLYTIEGYPVVGP